MWMWSKRVKTRQMLISVQSSRGSFYVVIFPSKKRSCCCCLAHHLLWPPLRTSNSLLLDFPTNHSVFLQAFKPCCFTSPARTVCIHLVLIRLICCILQSHMWTPRIHNLLCCLAITHWVWFWGITFFSKTGHFPKSDSHFSCHPSPKMLFFTCLYEKSNIFLLELAN